MKLTQTNRKIKDEHGVIASDPDGFYGHFGWEYDYILRDDGPDGDLGYPPIVEFADGSILTAYYQKQARVEDKCEFLWSRWDLP